MKYTIAIAALLGLVSAEEIYTAPANATAFTEKKNVKEASEDDDDSDVQASDDSDSDVQASDDSDSEVQLSKEKKEDDSDDDVQASEDDSDDDVQASEDDSDDEVQASGDSDDDDDVQASDDSDDDDVQASDDSDDDDVQASDDSDDDDVQDDSDSDVQLEKDEESSDHSGEFFEAREHGTGPLDKKYERVVPTNFAEGSDDLFMRSMIKTYALEGKNKDGSPNGQFFMDEATTRAAAGEVLETHKGLKGGAKQDYLKTYYPRTWAHFDVNKGGKIGVETMPQFMRFLASDQTLSL